MFVLSFKASSAKILGIICVCLVAVIVSIALLPGAGSSLNVNKIEGMQKLSKINAGKADGRIEYFEMLGFSVKSEPVSCEKEKMPKVMDAVTEKYNSLQRMQGFDLSRYCGKNLDGYTYEVTSFPDDTRIGANRYLATLIVYKNKVVAADICCSETGEVLPLITQI